VTHSLPFFRSQWHQAGRVLEQHREWCAFLYGVTCSAVALWVIPDWFGTSPLLMIAVGLPLIFPRLVLRRRSEFSATRNDITAMSGVVMVLIGVVWLIALGP
jgi:hypothetical protein